MIKPIKRDDYFWRFEVKIIPATRHSGIDLTIYSVPASEFLMKTKKVESMRYRFLVALSAAVFMLAGCDNVAQK